MFEAQGSRCLVHTIRDTEAPYPFGIGHPYGLCFSHEGKTLVVPSGSNDVSFISLFTTGVFHQGSPVSRPVFVCPLPSSTSPCDAVEYTAVDGKSLGWFVYSSIKWDSLCATSTAVTSCCSFLNPCSTILILVRSGWWRSPQKTLAIGDGLRLSGESRVPSGWWYGLLACPALAKSRSPWRGGFMGGQALRTMQQHRNTPVPRERLKTACQWVKTHAIQMPSAIAITAVGY